MKENLTMGLPTLTPHQEDAVKEAKDWFAIHGDYKPDLYVIGVADSPVFYLAGFAGTGKSTILPVIIDALGLPMELIRFCAPTGKAAKVMTEKLKAYGIDKRATTIHSLIYRPHPLRAEVLDKMLRDLEAQRLSVMDAMHDDGESQRSLERLAELDRTIGLVKHDLDKAFDNTEGPKFHLNVDSDIRKARLVVVDEGSMVGLTAGDDLKSFGVPILVMGDPGQLPPVGEPPGLTGGDPDFFLSEIHRQAKDNPIIYLATEAREGRSLKIGNYGDGVQVVSRANDNATYDANRDAQIIVGTNKKRWMVTAKLRRELGFRSTGPCKDEPLIICKNSKNIPDLVNGSFVNCEHDAGDLEKGDTSIKLLVMDEFGVQRSILAFQGLLEEHMAQKKGVSSAPKHLAFRARIENEHVDFGWAITTHKAQGSQWEEVVLHDESGVFREDAAKHLYTGITRAAKRLTVVL
jgi:exodeoxyribonuclease-5